MKIITLTQDKFAIVDDEDYEYLNQWKWYPLQKSTTCYATRHENNKIIKMHRIVMDAPVGMDVHHINGNGLDNTKQNMRVCTRSMHQYNRHPKKGKYKGVTMSGRTGKWQARIKVNKKYISLGYYTNKEDAARAYDKAVRKYAGEFARTNF